MRKDGEDVSYAKTEVGKPPIGYTKRDWQRDFADIKSKVTAVNRRKMNVIPDTGSNSHAYRGKTQYQYYCSFINDILNTIRHGKVDYCYYTYQVEELLKHEYDRLEVDWLEDSRCFKVSLN